MGVLALVGQVRHKGFRVIERYCGKRQRWCRRKEGTKGRTVARIGLIRAAVVTTRHGAIGFVKTNSRVRCCALDLEVSFRDCLEVRARTLPAGKAVRQGEYNHQEGEQTAHHVERLSRAAAFSQRLLG